MTASTTVTALMTIVAKNAEDIRILRFRESLMLRKNQTGSVLKTVSPIQSAVSINSKHGDRVKECLMLTGELEYESHPCHQTCTRNAKTKSEGEYCDPHEPEENTNAKGKLSEDALGMRHAHHGGQDTYPRGPGIRCETSLLRRFPRVERTHHISVGYAKEKIQFPRVKNRGI